MVSNATLTALPRDVSGKGHARKLRATGRVPAVVYGHGEQTRTLTVDAHELDRLFSQIHRENTIINLRIEGEKAEVRALVREVQSHPVKGDVLHVDFYQIHAGERITVQVPITLTGTPEGVKLGGVLQHALDELEIRCVSDHIPDEITVEVGHLGIGDSIHVSDITLPEGVESLVDGDRTICSVIAPTVVAAEAPVEGAEAAAAATPAEPEVIRRGKEEEAED
jgi:large subunit ribosomal protein L25